MPTILINGAGIAGQALAVLLARSGWSVTVTEIAPAPRTGGQTVDLRAGSRQVLARLGLLEQALAVLVPQRGIAWVDARGHRLAQMPVEAFDGRGFISCEELLRSDLAAILHRAAGTAGVHHLFADTVDSLAEHADGIDVRLRSGTTQTFDLVVGADGTHSRVRALRFGPEEAHRRSLGLATAWFTLTEGADTPTTDAWCLMHNHPGRLAVSVRPGHAGEQEIGFVFPTAGLPPRSDAAARRVLLQRVFADVGWRAQELLAAAEAAPDFAMDTFDQIHLDTWVDGRVVLLGDAAWCASPLSGLGTALGLSGAEALAEALGDGSSTTTAAGRAAALSAFEQRMRPPVRAAQKLTPGRVSMFAPRSRTGIRVSTALIRVVQWPVLRPVIDRIAAGSGHSASPDLGPAPRPTTRA